MGECGHAAVAEVKRLSENTKQLWQCTECGAIGEIEAEVNDLVAINIGPDNGRCIFVYDRHLSHLDIVCDYGETQRYRLSRDRFLAFCETVVHDSIMSNVVEKNGPYTLEQVKQAAELLRSLRCDTTLPPYCCTDALKPPGVRHESKG